MSREPFAVMLNAAPQPGSRKDPWKSFASVFYLLSCKFKTYTLMYSTYKFNPKDIPEITLHLLVESLSFNQAAIASIIDKLNLSEREKNDLENQINNEKLVRREKLIEALYETYGQTPNVWMQNFIPFLNLPAGRQASFGS